MSRNNIVVACRIRPSEYKDDCWFQADEFNSTIIVPSDEKLNQLKPTQFTYDYVAGPEVSQEDVFEILGVPTTEACIQGFNGTIICHGQTGTGKTHTIFGSVWKSDADSGLVPRIFNYLWTHIEREERCATYHYLTTFF